MPSSLAFLPFRQAFLPFILFIVQLSHQLIMAELAVAVPKNDENVAATFPLLQTRPFIVEPQEDEEIFVREGQQPGPQLNCSVGEQFRDRNRYELEWTKVVGDTPNLISRNGRLFSSAAPDGYELLDTVQQDGAYNLRLRSVQFHRDNGRFFCAHIDTETRQQTLSEPAKIVVLVPPQPPQIIGQPSEAVRESEFITFRCASTGGNPPPKFHWFFDNKSAIPDTWFHDRVEAGGAKSISTLQMHVKREHHKAHLVCKIWNKAMENGQFLEAETMRLNVLYAPRVHIQPAGLAEMNVEEGDTVPLVCAADSNPVTAQFQWIHVLSGQIHTEKEWHLAVRRELAGEFRCTATNLIDSASEKIRLNVLYGPTVRIKMDSGAVNGTMSAAEGDRLVLDCEADANPKADAFAWIGPGGVRQNGTRLVLDSVNRAYSGNFTCTAWNKLSQLYSKSSAENAQQTVIRTGYTQFTLDVRRKPGTALILANRTVFNVGETITLGCTMDEDSGNPPAKFKWIGPRQRRIHGKEQQADWQRAQLRVADAKLTDNGLYKCVPYNEIGQGEEMAVRVMIVEPAHITRPLPPSKTPTSSGMNFEIECEARGFPQPRIIWLKDGQPLPIESSQLWSLREKTISTGCAQPDTPCAQSLQSALLFRHPISWAYKGNYSCQAENSPTTSLPVFASTLVSIIHEPVILNQAFAPNEVALAAANLGTSARIVCRVSARPEPKISWNRDGLTIGHGFEGERRYKIRLSKVTDAIDEFESTLELDQVEECDFGTFVCETKNGAGGKRSAMEIRLQPKGQPQMPIQPKMLQHSLNWLQIGWRPGFDGGERQVFELEYRPVDPYTGRGAAGLEMIEFTFGPTNWSSLAVFETDPDSAKPTTFLVHNLTQLRPQSSFWFRLRARNSRGLSDWTPIAMASTEDSPDSMDIQSPESLQYLVDEQRLVVGPLKNSPAHCLLVYAASQEDGNWRSIDCFPLANSDGIIAGIEPAERFKVRYCMTNDVSKCSAGIKIFVENLPSANSFWMLAFIVGCVCVLSFSVLIALLCCRRRFQKATTNGGRAGHHHPVLNDCTKQHRKKLNLNGGVMMDSRIDKNGGAQLTNNNKNTPVNGSQTDSGVFTLGSSSAMAATAVALNGMGGRGAGNLVGICAERHDTNANSTDEWKHQREGAGGGMSPRHLSPHHLVEEPYDFSNDPFLQEFAAANALGGIVVVENSLHRDSSAESTPSHHQQQQKSYSKFFNDFSAAFLGPNANNNNAGGKKMPTNSNNRHSALILPRRGGGENGGGNIDDEREPTGNSNEQLIASGEGSDTASSSAGFGGANGNGRNAGRGESAGGRVMREIIV